MVRGQLSARGLEELLGHWRSAGPAYEALADVIRLLVLEGRISADVRLPAERELATRLGVSRTTVTAAYRHLREAGFVQSTQGSGTSTTLPTGQPPAAGDERGAGLLDFTRASLPATRLLHEAVEQAMSGLPAHTGGPGYDTIGMPELRAAIADRYAERGLPTTPDQIIVTTGAQSAIALVARALVARGDRAYAEGPSYPNAYDAITAAGARLVTSPVTVEDGWDIEALETAFRRTSPTMAYVMPEFHNPTSRTMPLEQRVRLLHVAARMGTVVVADETTAELDIDGGDSPPPIAALADRAAAHVVLIGSASKLAWGGLRIGWIRAAGDLLSRVAVGRAATDLGTPILEQLVVARLLRSVPEIRDERRVQLTERRAALWDAVGELLPSWTLPPAVHGGLTAWIGIGAPASSQLVLAARARGLLATAGPRFGIDGAFERQLRMPFTAEPDDIRRAVEILAECWPVVNRFDAEAIPSVSSMA
jgi:DNA-binding transcriptional MocR family regulator